MWFELLYSPDERERPSPSRSADDRVRAAAPGSAQPASAAPRRPAHRLRRPRPRPVAHARRPAHNPDRVISRAMTPPLAAGQSRPDFDPDPFVLRRALAMPAQDWLRPAARVCAIRQPRKSAALVLRLFGRPRPQATLFRSPRVCAIRQPRKSAALVLRLFGRPRPQAAPEPIALEASADEPRHTGSTRRRGQRRGSYARRSRRRLPVGLRPGTAGPEA